MVVDALRGFIMAGEKIPAPAAAGGHVTYVLVVNKSFKEDPRYHEFIRLFQAAAEELNNPDVLVEEIKKYKNIDLGSEEVEEWNRLGMLIKGAQIGCFPQLYAALGGAGVDQVITL